MNPLVAVVQSVLALLFAVAGMLKLATPYDRFVELPFQGWASDFRSGHLRLIGAAETGAAVAGAASLTWGSAHALGMAASVGMALVMAGAMATHLRRGEYGNMLGNAAWLAAALYVAGARYHDLVVT